MFTYFNATDINILILLYQILLTREEYFINCLFMSIHTRALLALLHENLSLARALVAWAIIS